MKKIHYNESVNTVADQKVFWERDPRELRTEKMSNVITNKIITKNYLNYKRM